MAEYSHFYGKLLLLLLHYQIPVTDPMKTGFGATQLFVHNAQSYDMTNLSSIVCLKNSYNKKTWSCAMTKIILEEFLAPIL